MVHDILHVLRRARAVAFGAVFEAQDERRGHLPGLCVPPRDAQVAVVGIVEVEPTRAEGEVDARDDAKRERVDRLALAVGVRLLLRGDSAAQDALKEVDLLVVVQH